MLTRSRHALHIRYHCSRGRILSHYLKERAYWFIDYIEENKQIIRAFKMLLSWLLAAVLIPLAIHLYFGVKFVRFVARRLFHRIYTDLTLARSECNRCILDTRRNRAIVTFMLHVQGRIALSEGRKQILAQIVERKSLTNGQTYEFPNFKRILTSKFGAYAWRKCNEFDIANHVSSTDVRWKGQTSSDAHIQRIVDELCSRPLPEDKPPWQVILLNIQGPYMESDTVMVLFRLHHLISENMYLKNVITETFSGDIRQSEIKELPVRIPDDVRINSKSYHQAKARMLLSSDSATSRVFHHFRSLLHRFWRYLVLNCDPNKTEGVSAGWFCVRKAISAVINLQQELQKVYELTERNYGESRSMWHRTVVLIYFLPRLMRRFECLWSMTLVESVSILVRCPVLIAQQAWLTTCASSAFAVTTLSEARLFPTRPIYDMIKDSMAEIGNAIMLVLDAPYVLISEFLRTPEPYPLLQRSGSVRKAVAWSEPISLVTVDKVKSVTGSSLNEVLTCVCAGSVAYYFKVNGLQVPDSIRTVVPVYSGGFVESSECATSGFLTLELPTGQFDVLSRLKDVKKQMDEIRKRNPKYLISVFLLRYCQHFLPEFVTAIGTRFLSRQYPLMLSNVVVPKQVQLKLWNRNVKSIYYWKPPQANTVLSLCLVSYDGQIRLMVMSDQVIVPQPHIITDHFVREFHNLAYALGIRRDRVVPSTFGQAGRFTTTTRKKAL